MHDFCMTALMFLTCGNLTFPNPVHHQNLESTQSGTCAWAWVLLYCSDDHQMYMYVLQLSTIIHWKVNRRTNHEKGCFNVSICRLVFSKYKCFTLSVRHSISILNMILLFKHWWNELFWSTIWACNVVDSVVGCLSCCCWWYSWRDSAMLYIEEIIQAMDFKSSLNSGCPLIRLHKLYLNIAENLP